MNLKKTKGCDFDLLRGLPQKRKMLPNIMTEWRWHKRILRFKPMSSLGQIRLILLAAMPLSACGCKKFQIDALGDHLCTCTAHSGAKKAHDWAADQIADLFRPRHKVQTQQVARSRVQRCGDIQLAAYLANAAGPVPLVLDLRIAHERVGSSSDPGINGHLRYPNDLDGPLNEAAADKIRQYRADYNNRPSDAISFICLLSSVLVRWIMRLGVYMVNLCALYFCRLIGKLTAFLQLQHCGSH